MQNAFAAQVARTPDTVATRCGDVELSYRALDGLTNALAQRLLGLGVGPEVPVAVLMERSEWLVVAILAVVKAGGTYLPLHSGHPASRRQAIVDSCGAPLLLTDVAWRARGVPDGPVPVVVDGDRLADGTQGGFPGVVSAPDQLAYVMFTSGSTGVAKGIGITHRDVLDLVFDRIFDTGRHERVLMIAPYAFDASTYELWVPLLRGGTVVVPPEGKLEIGALARQIAEERITAIHLTAGLFRVMAEEAPKCFASVVEVITGGDVVSAAAVRRVQQACPHTVVRAMYGPTEITLFATGSEIAQDEDLSGGVPIGVPLDNTRAYVLDDRLTQVPVGVIGELYLSGAGLARGYVGRPGLTAERFVADPFAGDGRRMYRTGDLVRWSSRQLLEFISRDDDQVKIRGFRVEPGEVETFLAGYPGLAQVAVVARESGTGDRHLVGYVVPSSGSVDKAAELPGRLRAYLSDCVPDYAVPTAIVVLSGGLPLTPNGKLDRSALPAPPAQARSGRRPRTPREEILCDLFTDLLGVGDLGIDDDFFELGGNSLLATRLVNRVRRLLGEELSMSELFEAPTVGSIAARLGSAGGPMRVELQPVDRPRRMPLSSAQRRMWFTSRMPGLAVSYRIGLAARMWGVLDRDALARALADVLDRHESLRTIFPIDGDQPYQRVLNDAPVAIAVREVTEAELAEAVGEAVAQPFDLAVDLPVRAVLFVLGDDESVLLLVLHHICADAWSKRPLTTDLATAYAARVAGRAPRWTPLPVQYADYTLWQRRLLGSPDDPGSLHRKQLSFWTANLAGLPEEIALPTDRPRLTSVTFRGAVVPLEVPVEVHTGLLALARSAKVTLFMVLHAALAVLCHRLGAGEDIPIGTVVAARNDDRLEDLAGFFVNALVLRTDVSGNPTFSELLGRVRRTDLAAFAHQDLPFDAVVEVLNPTRVGARHPLFQVALVLQNNADAEPEFAQLRTASYPVEVPLGHFDFSLLLTERSTSQDAPAGMVGSLNYNEDLFERTTVVTLAERFARVLYLVCANPDVRLSALDIRGPGERARIPSGCNGSRPVRVAGSLGAPVDTNSRDNPQALAQHDGGTAGSEPRPQLEADLCRLFARVLGVARVDVRDNFFDLGGHSLLAAQLINRVRVELGLELDILRLFDAPTIAELVVDLAESEPGRPTILGRR